MSRGAALACFVDSDPRAAAAIRANVETLGAGTAAQILCRSVDALPPQKPFDLVFADPPYAAGSGSSALASILSAGWAAPGSWLCIETERREAVDPQECTLETQRDIGRARITLLRA